jgi:hypothetical protein
MTRRGLLKGTLALASIGAAGLTHAGVIVAGLGEGGEPMVYTYNAASPGVPLNSFLAYTASFQGGVRVAAGDVNGDGPIDMVTGAGPGGGPHVSAFSGAGGSTLSSFFAYNAAFSGGVYVAAGDLDHDGHADFITGPGSGGGPQVRVFSGNTGSPMMSFYAFDPGFTGGVRVAAGDVNHDGTPDIVAGAGPGGAPHVKVFSGADGSLLRDFFAYSPSFTGGVFVASGDVNGDGWYDLITAPDTGGSSNVKVFSGADGSLLMSFLAFGPSFTGGVRLASADVDGDGRADIIAGAGPGALPEVRVFSGANGSLMSDFLVGDPDFTGGVYVAAAVPSSGPIVLLLAAMGLTVQRRRRS